MNRLIQFALVVGVVLVANSTAPAAHALLFNWEFTTDASSTGGAGQMVKGTIEGLVEGSNTGDDLKIFVTETPTGDLLGGGWAFGGTNFGGDAFTLTGGQVTFADAGYSRGFGSVFFGVSFAPSFYPKLIGCLCFGCDPFVSWQNQDGSTTFSSLGSSPGVSVPEPDTLAIFGLGLAGLGFMRRRRAA